MKASDEILHEQLNHLVKMGRQAVVADLCVMVAKGYDEEVEATASMVVFSLVDEEKKSEDEAMQAVVLALAQAIDTILRSRTNMEVILRHRKSGVEWKPGESSFGHRVVDSP